MSFPESFQLDALQTEKELRRRIVDFAESRSFLRDQDLMATCRKLWSGPEIEGGLVGQLWIEGIFPAKSSGKNLRDLAQEGVVSDSLVAQLEASDAFSIDRQLYAHQAESITASVRDQGSGRPGIVVTAGTGAGKTEAFLLPLLNDLYSVPKVKRSSTKAIILYPMNALVNDQVERLYRWLKGQKRITLFHLTSETPEDARRADDIGYPKFEPCRLRTRQQARENPPDILITNYSMLEYMLCRPQDAPFFSPDLRTFVLDEAHLYSGTLAAEISLLLKRVFLRCGRDSREILTLATSATLGDGVNNFAARVFSKDVSNIIHIDGAVDRCSFPQSSPPAKSSQLKPEMLTTIAGKSFTHAEELAQDEDTVRELATILPGLVAEEVIREHISQTKPAIFLFNVLAHAPLVQKLEDALFNARGRGVIELSTLTAEVLNDSSPGACSSLVALLQLCARARLTFHSYPLIPHKAHILVRASGTMSACVNPSCAAPADVRLPGGGRLVADIRTICPDCGSKMLTLARCSNCGEWLLAGIYSGKDNSFSPRSRWHTADMPRNMFYRFAVPSQRGGEGKDFHFDLVTGRCEPEGNSIQLRGITECINCYEPVGDARPMGIPDALALPVSVEAVFGEMPVFPEDKRHWLPARGRRLLIFSDSRKEAARLGPLLTDQHELQMIRAVIMETLQTSISDERSRQRLERDIQRLADDLNDPTLTDNERRDIQQELEIKMQRQQNLLLGGAMTDWVQQLKGHPLLAEFFCRPNAIKHRADTWSQKDWDFNRIEIAKTVEEMLVREFVSPAWSKVTLETLGLAEVLYPGLEHTEPPVELLAILPSGTIRENIIAAWPDLLAMLCDTIRSDGAVTVGDPEKDREWPYFPIGRWMSKAERFGAGYLLAFKGTSNGPRESRRNRYCRNVLLAAGCSPVQAESIFDQFMEALFGTLLELAANDECLWLEKSSRQQKDGLVGDAIRIKFLPLALRIPLKLFRCQISGAVFSRSVLACSILSNTPGTLFPVTKEDLKKDPYFGRAWNSYMQENSLRIGIWAEEHSAQLDHNETRRLQELFITGARNVLSATTTLEVGIDIGGLSGVVLANVPPGKANYQQRGGRAGRRSDGSSLVMTYCRSTAYDQSVFHDFSHFFRQPLRKPTVLLERERFARRHLHAFLLGEFYGCIQPEGVHVGAMTAFGRIGEFCSAPLIRYIDNNTMLKNYEIEAPPHYAEQLICAHSWWLKDGPHLAAQFVSFLRYLADNPQQIIPQARKLLSATPGGKWLEMWAETIAAIIGDFEAAIGPWMDDYYALLDAWRTERDRPRADIRALNAMYFQSRALRNATLIEELGSRRFLPRYGFPIGLQSLTIPSGKGNKDSISLQRDGIVAISEYVPGSSILVGGRTYTSRGLQKSWGHEESGVGRRAWMYRCLSGHVFHRPLLEASLSTCTVQGCNAPIGGAPLELLIPRFGYSTALWDPPTWKSDPDRVGSTSFSSTSFAQNLADNTVIESFGGITGAVAQLCEGGELLAFNSGEHGHGFVICTRCGYSESERLGTGIGRENLPKRFETHSPLASVYTKNLCWQGEDGAPVLRHQHLAATHVTDLIQIDFSRVASPKLRDGWKAIVNTIGHALRLAGAELLEADHRELGMICLPVGPTAYHGLQIFDNAAGGAGHVVELAADADAWIRRAKQVLFRDADHHAVCEKGCLRCILTTASQRDWEMGNLVRREAYEVLESILDGAEVEISVAQQAVQPTPSRSTESRLAKLRGKNGAVLNKPATVLPEDWQQTADTMDPALMPLLQDLYRNGVALPVCGYDLIDDSRLVVATAELCWPESKFALFVASENSRGSKVPGWRTMTFSSELSITELSSKIKRLTKHTL